MIGAGMRSLSAMKRTYTATFERTEDGTWMVALVEEPNVHGYGDTLVAARRNICEAITTLFGPFESGDGFELVEDVRLPDTIQAMIQRARVQRTQANERRAEARAAEEALTATTRQATEVTRHAARLLVEHGDFMLAEVDDPSLVEDVRLPDAVVLAVEQAHLARQAARTLRDTAEKTKGAAAVISTDAIATNRDVANLLVEQCGLTTAEAGGFLGLSPAQTERLLSG